MKRWRERDYDPNLDKIYEEPHKPLWVEPIAPRSQRQRYGLPALIAAFLVMAFVVATISRFVALFSGPPASPTPPPEPTPISWVDTIIVNGPPGSPSLTTSASPSGGTPSRQPTISISAQGPAGTQYWSVGQAAHFTLELWNNASGPISLDPCPAYRMYLTGTASSNAPLRLLNCNAMGKTIEVGQTMSVDMVYTPTAGDPVGNQTLVWEWLSPDTTIQATAIISVYIRDPSASAAP